MEMVDVIQREVYLPGPVSSTPRLATTAITPATAQPQRRAPMRRGDSYRRCATTLVIFAGHPRQDVGNHPVAVGAAEFEYVALGEIDLVRQ